MPDTIESPLALQLTEAQLTESEATVLHDTFAPFFTEAQKWRQQAEAITVTSAADNQKMMEARKVRLALKDIRVKVEHARKRLKEESLRKGKAIDGLANVIKYLIAPIEEDLDRKENFVKLREEKAREELTQRRAAELAACGADPAFYDLGTMPEDTYAKLLETARQADQMKKDAEARAEQERIERERVEAEERERVRIENERLKKEAEERQRQIDRERAAREQAEAELRAKRQAEERAERDRQEQERKAARAPDKDKLLRLADAITSLPMPDVSSDEATAVVKAAIAKLADASQFVRTQAIAL